LRSGERDLADVAVEPMTVPVGMAVSDLIDQFQRADQELALVVDEREIVGLVTVTDAFECITGELQDPIDLGEHGLGRGGESA
ncbi:MAG: CBS domain-containing protein, partial [Haloarculaceae archaeon]